MFLYDFKMFQRRFYGYSHFFCWMRTRTIQFVHSIRCIVHRQAEFTLYFSNICRMNFEAVILLNPFLNLLICRLFLRFSFFRSLRNCRFIKRSIIKIDFHFKMRISFFCGIIPPTSRRVSSGKTCRMDERIRFCIILPDFRFSSIPARCAPTSP